MVNLPKLGYSVPVSGENSGANMTKILLAEDDAAMREESCEDENMDPQFVEN